RPPCAPPAHELRHLLEQPSLKCLTFLIFRVEPRLVAGAFTLVHAVARRPVSGATASDRIRSSERLHGKQTLWANDVALFCRSGASPGLQRSTQHVAEHRVPASGVAAVRAAGGVCRRSA